MLTIARKTESLYRGKAWLVPAICTSVNDSCSSEDVAIDQTLFAPPLKAKDRLILQSIG